ncbi:hypothetical protein [Flavobacterium sp.]|uniref:hypothetical protein n=1 Tax=Flavobacterium sp. TaxID=239 RepID=UPI00374CFFB6
MLLIALGFGTMSLTPSSNNVIKTSVNNQKEVEVVNVVAGPTYTAPYLGNCCESPLTAIERDIVNRGYNLAITNYIINSVGTNTVTYTIY